MKLKFLFEAEWGWKQRGLSPPPPKKQPPPPTPEEEEEALERWEEKEKEIRNQPERDLASELLAKQWLRRNKKKRTHRPPLQFPED